jgi:hypothetical protein
MTPRRWRLKLPPGTLVGLRTPEYIYGCYFPAADLNVVETGARPHGSPDDWPGLEWLDPDEAFAGPTAHSSAAPPLTTTPPPASEHAPPVPLQRGILSLDDPRAPKYWMHETSGVLRPAIEGYLNRRPLTLFEVATIRAYLRQWIFSPVWDGLGGDEELARLRRQIDGIRNRADIDRWIRDALEEGHDPL